MWKLRDILREQKALLDEKMSDEVKMAELEGEFMAGLQKLVNSSFGTVTKVSLSQIKDLFNAVGERLDKISKETPKDTILLLLNSAIALSAQNYQNEKVDSVKVSYSLF